MPRICPETPKATPKLGIAFGVGAALALAALLERGHAGDRSARRADRGNLWPFDQLYSSTADHRLAS